MLEAIHVETLGNCHAFLIRVTGQLHILTVSAPPSPEWDAVQDKISALDSIADVMRPALNTWPGSPTSYEV